MSAEIARKQPGFMDLIQQAMTLPPSEGLDRVELIERLYALKERDDAKTAKVNFDAALLRVQMQAKPIAQNGMMDRGPGKGQIPYAKREDIDAMMRPIYQAEGFTVTWDYPRLPDSGIINVTGYFTACGHTETRVWPCLPDASGGKTGPQAVSSTGAYGKRQISKMMWDIVEHGLDVNGADKEDVTPISEHQALEIRTRMNDLPQSKPGLLLEKLCRKYGVEKPEDLRLSQYDDACADVFNTEKQKAGK